MFDICEKLLHTTKNSMNGRSGIRTVLLSLFFYIGKISTDIKSQSRKAHYIFQAAEIIFTNKSRPSNAFSRQPFSFSLLIVK
jgi:hypothetical protein